MCAFSYKSRSVPRCPRFPRCPRYFGASRLTSDDSATSSRVLLSRPVLPAYSGHLETNLDLAQSSPASLDHGYPPRVDRSCEQLGRAPACAEQARSYIGHRDIILNRQLGLCSFSVLHTMFRHQIAVVGRPIRPPEYSEQSPVSGSGRWKGLTKNQISTTAGAITVCVMTGTGMGKHVVLLSSEQVAGYLRVGCPSRTVQPWSAVMADSINRRGFM